MDDEEVVPFKRLAVSVTLHIPKINGAIVSFCKECKLNSPLYSTFFCAIHNIAEVEQLEYKRDGTVIATLDEENIWKEKDWSFSSNDPLKESFAFKKKKDKSHSGKRVCNILLKEQLKTKTNKNEKKKQINYKC